MPEPSILAFADFRVDAPNGRLWRAQEPLPVPPKVFSVLHHLVERPQQLVTKADLFAHVWPETAVGDAVLTVAIGELRKLLGDDPRSPRFIETVHRRGYRFIAPVTNETPSRETARVPRRASVAEDDVRQTRPAIVGRDAELGELHALLDASLAGERQIVFVTGAPGLGKTTLVDAFLEQVAARESVWIAKGQCVEHYGAGEAFLPVFEALGTLAHEVPAGEYVPLLRRYAPSWLAQMPKLLDEDDFVTLLRTTAGVAPERRLREMLDALEELAARAPLVLVLEDLHWSDVSTIDLVAALARRRSPARLLVLGTYRPADLVAQAHPLRAVVQDLVARRLGSEVALDLLARDAIDSYLERRFPEHRFPAELAVLLQERTDGNPLFMVHLVADWLAHRCITRATGAWQVESSLSDLGRDVPPSLRALIEQHVARLDADAQELVDAASVVGEEFCLRSLAAVLASDVLAVERRCEDLVSRDVLEPRGVGRGPDGSVTSRYGFRHALYRTVLYERMPAVRRQEWHRRIGQVLEDVSGTGAAAMAPELALHFEHGCDEASAVRYLLLAAQSAMLRSAHREAIGYLRRGLGASAALPEGAERDRMELVLRVALGVALSATQGYAAPEVAETYTRALALCRSTGGAAELFSTLHGLCRFYGVRADFRVAIEVGDRLYGHAEERGDPALLLEASWARGTMLVYRGEIAEARRLLEQGVALYSPAEHASHAHVYGQDPGVACLSYLAWVALVAGAPDEAVRRSDQALALAHELGHPFTLAFALHHAALTYHQRGDGDAALRHVDRLVALAGEEEFPFWATMAQITRGGEMMRDGRVDEGLEAIEQGLAVHRMLGADIGSTYWLALLAEARARRGARDAALAAVDEALALVESGSERLWEADLHRIKGDVLLGTLAPDCEEPAPDRAAQEEAAACFARAIDVAEAQGARLWTLRAATRLARLWARQRKRKRALELLVPVHASFDEATRAPDVRAAAVLLGELRG